MKKKLFAVKSLLFFIFLICAVAPVYAKPAEWLRKIKRIELLKSTRVEVEKLFGDSRVVEMRDLAAEFKNGWGKEVKYETKYGTLEVWYAAGKCAESKGKPYSFDVAADVAMAVTFLPSEIVFENQLGYDLNKFKIDSDWNADKIFSLETENSKTTVKVKELQVTSIEYDVSEKLKTRLECKNVFVKEPVWFEKLRTLKLFKSTRSEVEALFDNLRIVAAENYDGAGDNWNTHVEYETTGGKLEVSYSTGKCSERRSRSGFDAARETLVELDFEPAEKFDLTELNFDFRKIKSSSMPGVIIKKIPELSISIYYDMPTIELVRISPNDEQEEEFDCSEIWDPKK